MNKWLAVSILPFVLMVQPTYGKTVYKCQSTTGKTVYTNKPCKVGSKKNATVKIYTPRKKVYVTSYKRPKRRYTLTERSIAYLCRDGCQKNPVAQ